jgi:hypothetical protein
MRNLWRKNPNSAVMNRFKVLSLTAFGRKLGKSWKSQSRQVSNQISIQATSFSNNTQHSAVLHCVKSLELSSHLILKYCNFKYYKRPVQYQLLEVKVCTFRGPLTSNTSCKALKILTEIKYMKEEMSVFRNYIYVIIIIIIIIIINFIWLQCF